MEEDTIAKMDLRTRVCLWIIIIGLMNFLAYTVTYSLIGGEAVNGKIEKDAETGKTFYYLRSSQEHDGKFFYKVHRDMFLYSGIHSISIWATVMAVMLAMLTLAKDRIIGSMRSAIMTGRSLITVLAVIISISMIGITLLFIRQFASHFQNIPTVSHSIQAGNSSSRPDSPQLPK